MPLPLPLKADIRLMLDDFGVPVTIGGVTVKGLLWKPDAQFLQDGESELIGRAVTVLIGTGDLPGLAVGASVTVDGEAMTVHRSMAESDGEVTRILCTKA